MRVDAYTQVQQLYGTKQTRKVARDEKAAFQDRLQISSKGKDIQTAKHAVEGVSDIREDVVESLKKAIGSGSYKVSGEAFANRLFEKYNEMNPGSF